MPPLRSSLVIQAANSHTETRAITQRSEPSLIQLENTLTEGLRAIGFKGLRCYEGCGWLLRRSRYVSNRALAERAL